MNIKKWRSFVEKNIAIPLITFFFPNFCFFCNSLILDSMHSFICDLCKEKKLIYLSDCVVDLKIFVVVPHFNMILSSFVYNSIMQLWISHGKFAGNPNVFQDLGKLFVQHIQLKIPMGQGLLVPVPISTQRCRERGFNPAVILAQMLGDHFNIPVKMDILKKIKHNMPQSSLSFQQRLKNPKHCYVAERVSIQNNGFRHPTYLVDDIVTTGATVNVCAQALKSQGFQNIIVLAPIISYSKQEQYYHDSKPFV